MAKQQKSEDEKVGQTNDPAEGPEQRRKSAGSLEEALAANSEADAAAAAAQEDALTTARQEAAQAELDAQQADRDAGYATSAEEGPSTPKPVDREDDK